jgi:RimJ/RimL family protein N-acetyltransferase
MTAPTITTMRLRLRNWRASDLEAYAAMNADPRVMEFYLRRLDRVESDASARRNQAFLDKRGFGLWAMEELGGASFIGYVRPGRTKVRSSLHALHRDRLAASLFALG